MGAMRLILQQPSLLPFRRLLAKSNCQPARPVAEQLAARSGFPDRVSAGDPSASPARNGPARRGVRACPTQL
jgi:hypothetical protein